MKKVYIDRIKKLLCRSSLFVKILLWVKNDHIKIKGIENTIQNAFNILKCHIEITGYGNIVKVSDSSVLLNCKIVINGNNNCLLLGSESFMEKGIFLFGDNDNEVSIGEANYIYHTVFTVNEGTTIKVGKNCLISRADIRTGDNHSVIDLISKDRINKSRDVLIDSHVWLGNNSMVLKGVKIENGSIVGAGSVVTKDVPANVVVVGNPARVIKRNVTWLHERV